MNASDHPANRRRRVLDRLAAARGSGNRTAYDEARADLAAVNKYEAGYLGIPSQYVDEATGEVHVPENICRACWEDITGPVFAMGVDGSCLHYHPDCRPRYAGREPRPLDTLYPAGWQHPRRSCRSQLPHYLG